MTGFDETLGPRLAALDAQHLRRVIRPSSTGSRPRVRVDGRELVQFCSNDYLGLASDPRLARAAADAVFRFGSGSGSSRLVGGTTSLHADLEKALAELKSTEGSLVYASGYQANLGVLSGLMGKNDVIFSDELNHASLIDGCRLSRARVLVYRHLDLDHLEQLLTTTSTNGQRLVVTETVFSMDGDVVPLRELVTVAHRRDAWIMVDEAHATGVFGNRGGGVAQEMGLTKEIDIQIGTLSKALGSLGAFAAGSTTLVNWLTNVSRPFIYSTALAAPSVAAALAAVTIVQNEPQRRERLWNHVATMRSELTSLGFQVGATRSPIIPLIIGDSERAVRFSSALLELGVLIPAIRPPTVPVGTARLRIVPMATHTTDDVKFGLEALADAGRVSGVIA